MAAARHMQDREEEGVTLGNLGLAYFNLGETRRAIHFYEQRLTMAREMDDRRGEGVALGNLGHATPSWARYAAPSGSINNA